MKEKEFKQHPFYKYISVSKDGRVKSLKTGIILKPHPGKRGWLRVGFRDDTSPRGQRTKYVHRLVAETYVKGHTNERNCVNHIDGNRINNHADNLEWCTYKENSEHAARLGLIKAGVKSHRSKFTERQILEILGLYYETDENTYTLARKFDAGQRTIFQIVKGFTYKELYKKYFK